MPPSYVKPYVKRGKTDAADAEAICEALIQVPLICTHSPDVIAAACPTTVTRSRWPRALIRSTQKPLSALWNVTRSTSPASASIGGPLALDGAVGTNRVTAASRQAEPGRKCHLVVTICKEDKRA